jgi:hypothetical protein
LATTSITCQPTSHSDGRHTVTLAQQPPGMQHQVMG